METLSLDKHWKFKPDPNNEGLEESWHSDSSQIWSDCPTIHVPSCWEEKFEDYEGLAWYATTQFIAADKKGQISRLCFQAVNYRAEVWINGHRVGCHEGGYTPFHFEIQDYLKYGIENHFVVRVLSPIVTKNLRIDGLGPNEMPHWRGGLTAGIWQSVSLEFNQSAWIESAFYRPRVEQEVFELALEVQVMTSFEAVIESELFDAAGNSIFQIKETRALHQGSNTLEQLIRVVNPILWTESNPHLYTAEVCISENGTCLAKGRERIGMRSFTYEEGRFFLNGERIFLKGGFWEGVYAKHQSYPEDREVVRKEIKLAKDAGLNLLRPWRRPVPPMILEEADAAGLLVIASPAVECMSCWPALTPETPKRIEHEIRELVLRDRNHACIIWWEMFNEVTRKEIAELIPKMSLMTSELDPTRLILDESGGWANGAHFYLPFTKKREALSELHSYVRAPVNEKHWKLYQGLGNCDTNEGNTEIKAGKGLFVSEFGFGGLPEIGTNCELFEAQGNALLPAYRQHQKLRKDIQAAIQSCGIETIYPHLDDFCRASQTVQARGNRRQLEALLANENVSGYCIHAFTDGDWILGAGLIDHWQRPKAAYHAIKAANTTPTVLCFPERRNLVRGNSVACDFVLRGENATLPTTITLTNGNQTHQLADLNWSGGSNFKRIQSTIPGNILQEGRNRLLLHALDTNGSHIYTAEIELFVVTPKRISLSTELVVYDPSFELTPWLEANHYPFIPLCEWQPNDKPITLLFVPGDVISEAHLQSVKTALDFVYNGNGSAIFIEPPAQRESKSMLREYQAARCIPPAENILLKSGIFPFELTARPSFSFWESSMHVVKAHPIFAGLPQDCLMDEPYHEIAPAESFYELDALESPAQTITWFRPEDEDKVNKRTYLGGEDLWHGTDLAVKEYGMGRILLSSLILRSKAGKDPVADTVLTNCIAYAEKLTISNTTPKAQIA